MTDPETCTHDRPATRPGLTRVALGSAVFACLLAACGPSGEKLLARAVQSAAGGDFRAAMIDLQNYVAKHPDDAGARAQLAVVMTELDNYPGAKTEVEKAKKLGAAPEKTILAECRIMVWEQEFKRVLDECAPPAGNAALAGPLATLRGTAQLSLGSYAEAQQAFAEALAADPADLEAIAGAAQAQYQTTGLPAARTVFQSAPASVRDQPGYWLALGDLEQRAGELNAAEKSFASAASKTKAGDKGRDRLFALVGLAEVQMSLGKSKEAKTTADRLLEEFPQQQQAMLTRARIARSQGDLAQARSLLEQLAAGRDEPIPFIEYELAGVLEQQGNLNQAEEHYAAAVLREPDNARYQNALARLRARTGSPEASLDLLRQSSNPDNLVIASEIQAQMGDRDEALKSLVRAQESTKATTPEAQLNIAAAFVSIGEFDRAMRILDAMPPGSAQVQTKRNALAMLTLLRQGNTAEAVRRAEQLVKESADEVSARNLAGGVLMAAQKYDLAREQFSKVVAAHPDNETARVNLARLELQADRPDAAAGQLQAVLATNGTSYLATAGMVLVAEAKKDADGAERWARKAVRDHPEAAEAHMALARLLLAKREPAQALKSAQEAVRLKPDSAATHTLLGVAQVSSGDVDAGISSFRTAVDKAPKAVGSHLNLARAYLLARKSTEAVAAVDQALTLEPKYVPALAIGAALSLRSGSVERAAGYVERLSAAAPGSIVALKLEGDLAMAQKRYRDAAGFYDRLAAKADDPSVAIMRFEAARQSGAKDPQEILLERLRKHPDDIAVRLVYAEQLERSGDAKTAAHEYESILEKAPKNVVALNNLAVIYQKARNPRAAELARAAYDSAPDNPMIADTYGWLLVERGELDRAIAILRKAAAHPAATPEIQYHLGAALARKGRRDEAVAVLRKVTAAPGAEPGDVKADASRLLAELER